MDESEECSKEACIARKGHVVLREVGAGAAQPIQAHHTPACAEVEEHLRGLAEAATPEQHDAMQQRCCTCCILLPPPALLLLVPPSSRRCALRLLLNYLHDRFEPVFHVGAGEVGHVGRADYEGGACLACHACCCTQHL